MKSPLSFGFKARISIAEALSEVVRQFYCASVMEIN